MYYLGNRLRALEERLTDDQHSLLFILLSLRLFPMSPNWLLNVSSPLLGVPLHLFFISVLLGQYYTTSLAPITGYKYLRTVLALY